MRDLYGAAIEVRDPRDPARRTRGLMTWPDRVIVLGDVPAQDEQGRAERIARGTPRGPDAFYLPATGGGE